MNCEDGAEDVRHSGIGKRVNRNDMKMSQTARRNFLTTSTRWAHSPPHLNILNVKNVGFFAIIPVNIKHMIKLHQIRKVFYKSPLAIIKVLTE